MSRQSDLKTIEINISNCNILVNGSSVEIGSKKTAKIAPEALTRKRKRKKWKALIELLSMIGTTVLWICQIIMLFVSRM